MKFLENQLKKAPVGIATGFNKGHVVTKKAKVVRHANRKGYLSKRVKAVREVVRETVGYTAYERRIMEILKGGGNNPQKRAYKYAKMKLGAHVRAKRCVNNLTVALSKIQLKK
eukprot:UN01399